MADPYKQAAEKLDKETKKVQEEQQANADLTWKNLHEGKIPAPTNNDMGPKPTVKKAKGGKVSSASKRADGCCIRGKTRA